MDEYFENLLKCVAFVMLLRYLAMIMEYDENTTVSTTSKKMSYCICMVIIVILFPDFYPVISNVVATFVVGTNSS